MIYPENFEIKTGFDVIRHELSQSCISEMGRERVAGLSFSADYSAVFEALEMTDEFRRILISGRNFPAQDYFDLRPELKRMSILGTFPDPEILGELGSSLLAITDILRYIESCNKDEYPHLHKLQEAVWVDPGILAQINAIIDGKGGIRDDASAELKDLRHKQEQKKRQVEKRIRLIWQGLIKDGVASDETELTIRNGRSVIPLPASNKRRIRGFIHDESATGQTVYIEPEEIFDLNNEIKELEAAEKREIIRILTAFADTWRPEFPNLLNAYVFLGQVDFVRARAKFALKIDGALPRLEKKLRLKFFKARNPLLFLSGKMKREEVVPLDIELGDKNRILIISGPNAGGKSVCLKTVGLLQYMLQCGLLIPLREDSECGIFKDIFIEIGDEQSIENDLSTYSSHLKNIKWLSESANSGCLFMIDELGSGTEPQLGGAIAEAVLEHLSESKAWGVVSTHYQNLKLLAGKVDGIINGAMLFDSSAMKPLYTLVTGKPGSSFAFEIARKTGLSSEILNSAEQKTGVQTVDLEKQLTEIETERRELEKQKQEFVLADDLLKSLVEKYQNLQLSLGQSRKQVLEEAKKEASDLLENVNQRIENTIKEIRENQADKEKTKSAREKLEELKKEISKVPESVGPDKNEKKLIKTLPPRSEVIKAPLKAGGYAVIRGQETFVEITSIQGKFATVVRENIRLRIPLDQLEGCEKPGTVKDKYKKSLLAGINKKIQDTMDHFSPSIDVRGNRAEEVIPLIQKFIDDAILLNVSEVSVLHGKGNGILRNIIREYLHGIDEVKSCRDEVLERGGSGITIVRMKE